jgi:hypothetical protein
MSQTTIPNTLRALSAGTIDQCQHPEKEGGYNAEASAEIPFGVAVYLDSGTTNGYLLRAGGSDRIQGVSVRLNDYAPALSAAPELGDDGILPEVRVQILRKGSIWVVCEDGCSPDDGLYVRKSGVGDQGACLAAAVGGETIDCTKQGTWRTEADAGDVALLEVDFANKP